MKRYISILIALVAIATGANASDLGIKIGRTTITTDNYESVSQGQAWYYVPAENVLYLTDGTIYGFDNGKVIEINSDKNPSLKICVQGDCILRGIVEDVIVFIGEGHHEIYGSGILRIYPDKTEAKGIYSTGNTYLTIKDVTIDMRVWSGIAIDSRLGFKEITIDNSEISMQTGDGYPWLNDNTTVKLRRCYVEGARFIYSSPGGIKNGDGTWTHDATIKRSLWDFNLTVNEPVAGGTVSNSCQVNGTGFEVAEVKWNKLLEGGYLTEDEGSIFQLGSTYEVIIRILANDGERIASREDCVATINGKPAEIFNSSDKFIVLRYTFPQLANKYFDVWVGGKQVNDINKSDVLDDGGSVSFIKNVFGKYVLILENANITNTGDTQYDYTGYGRGIYSNLSGLTIRVKGNNTIDSKGEGIYFTGNLDISGSTDNQGKLSVKGSYGIRPAKSSTAITLDISRVELTAEGTSGTGIGGATSFSSNYNCTLKVGIANTVVKAKGTSVSLGNLYDLVFEDGLKIMQPTGAYFDGEDVRDASGNRISKQWVVIGKESSITTGEALPLNDNGEMINDKAGSWFTIDGRKLNGQPTKKGVYIHNGKTVIR